MLIVCPFLIELSIVFRLYQLLKLYLRHELPFSRYYLIKNSYSLPINLSQTEINTVRLITYHNYHLAGLVSHQRDITLLASRSGTNLLLKKVLRSDLCRSVKYGVSMSGLSTCNSTKSFDGAKS